MYPYLLSKLARGIFIKENRFTWIIEQQMRFEATMNSFDNSTPKTPNEFLARYNEDIETMVLISNLGFAAEIDQAESALEKHFSEEKLSINKGVEDLKQL